MTDNDKPDEGSPEEMPPGRGMTYEAFVEQVLLEVTEITEVLPFADSSGGRRAVKGRAKKKKKDPAREKKRRRLRAVYRNYDAALNYSQDPKVKKAICAGLLSLTGDFADVAKTMVVLLYPMSLTGVISVPLTPAIYAALAWLVFKSGAHAYCADYL